MYIKKDLKKRIYRIEEILNLVGFSNKISIKNERAISYHCHFDKKLTFKIHVHKIRIDYTIFVVILVRLMPLIETKWEK